MNPMVYWPECMNENNYPIIPIELNRLDWKWFGIWKPGFDPNLNRNVRLYEAYKINLMNPEWVPKHPKDIKIKEIFESIKSVGMINPLIVGQYHPERYCVIVGNQRLAILRALNELGQLQSTIVNCVIEPDKKQWDTDHPPSREIHDY